MITKSLTISVTAKVLPRYICSVCGEYHSPTSKWEEQRLVQATGLNMKPQQGVSTRFSQCKNCISLHGTLIEMKNRPYEMSLGRFSKYLRDWITLKGTGPSDD